MDADQRARLISQGIDPDTYVEPTPTPTAAHVQTLTDAIASLQQLITPQAVPVQPATAAVAAPVATGTGISIEDQAKALAANPVVAMEPVTPAEVVSTVTPSQVPAYAPYQEFKPLVDNRAVFVPAPYVHVEDVYAPPAPAPVEEAPEAPEPLTALTSTPEPGAPKAPVEPVEPEAPIYYALETPYPVVKTQTAAPVATEAPKADIRQPELVVMAAQVGGDHYSKLAFQPLDFIVANKIGFIEGNVIKYVVRWQDKGGISDLRKAQDYLAKLIMYAQANEAPASS